MTEKIEKLREIINNAKKIVFFGGAGVSTESGIPDFRSGDGLYNRESGLTVPPEEVLSHDYFYNHTRDFYVYYRKNILHPEALPNKAHLALAKLEREGKLEAVVTQNIDGLHQLAGSKTVYELHGSVRRNHCTECKRSIETLEYEDGLPRCPGCGGLVKPDVVLYGESLPEEAWEKALKAVADCDTLIVGGTSLTVYPASSVIYYFRGKNLVIINRDATGFDRRATLLIHDSIGKVLDEAIREETTSF